MKKDKLEKWDVLFNRVYKLSEMLNEISMELASLIREVAKDEIGANRTNDRINLLISF